MRRTLFIVLCALGLAAAGCGSETPRRGDSGTPQEDGGTTMRDSGGDPDGGPTCTDGDGDGYGEGCALGPDCDDTSSAVSPAATESCNGVDDDCDEATDEDVGAPSCELSQGVCAGATQRCGPEGFLACEVSDYGADYEATETLCDGLDNDCDGTTDEDCTCEEGTTQPCGSDTGACAMGTQTCTGGAWGACDGEVGPMGEVCDGADNDCDGTSDEPTDLTPPDCPLQLGVCAGSRRTCGGASGWVACDGTASYGGDYQATETLCDGLDNDCDGVADEGCTCVDGATQPCGSDVGACVAGTQTCVAGAWGACAGEVGVTPETCNGDDDDCDGTIDDGVVGPACALTLGVCAGSTQACGGAAGFVACDASRYGSSYQATETSCDGQDNDCDGLVDEGCTCVDGATQACGLATGVCERGTQTCSGGEWGACTGGVEPAAELCNGLDDDCDGTSDDDLTAPACALTLGVCAGSRQTCGGAAGWQACAGTASYGPRYAATEDGASDESLCDGLDNDCNGTVDDGCASGPLVTGAADQAFPDLFNRHLVYSEYIGGNWELYFRNLDRGTARRLTTNAVDDLGARVSGHRVAFRPRHRRGGARGPLRPPDRHRDGAEHARDRLGDHRRHLRRVGRAERHPLERRRVRHDRRLDRDHRLEHHGRVRAGAARQPPRVRRYLDGRRARPHHGLRRHERHLGRAGRAERTGRRRGPPERRHGLRRHRVDGRPRGDGHAGAHERLGHLRRVVGGRRRPPRVPVGEQRRHEPRRPDPARHGQPDPRLGRPPQRQLGHRPVVPRRHAGARDLLVGAPGRPGDLGQPDRLVRQPPRQLRHLRGLRGGRRVRAGRRDHRRVGGARGSGRGRGSERRRHGQHCERRVRGADQRGRSGGWTSRA
ncbi:MAG: putative metal-binding motif-containing protein [Sandaracinaceae bacterium]|nr:putative metal-binding motif-containing protein [Sandaracinaceae bacterium]